MTQLKELRLWWTAWQRGIPIDSYGYDVGIASGDRYYFKVDPEIDCWLVAEKELLPISGASLYRLRNNSVERERLLCDSFTIMRDQNRVQLNKIVGVFSYAVEILPLNEVYIDGETFPLEE